MHHTEPGVVVHLSREGLRRAANDNALKRKTEASAIGEIAAYCVAMAGVILMTAWIVNMLAKVMM